MFLNVFKGLKQKVLWKWETEEMADKPDNVMLSKWLPQQEILAHPNCKLFITHGGQSSFQETLCHKKPVVSESYPISISKYSSTPFSRSQGTTFHYLKSGNSISGLLQNLDKKMSCFQSMSYYPPNDLVSGHISGYPDF